MSLDVTAYLVMESTEASTWEGVEVFDRALRAALAPDRFAMSLFLLRGAEAAVGLAVDAFPDKDAAHEIASGLTELAVWSDLARSLGCRVWATVEVDGISVYSMTIAVDARGRLRWEETWDRSPSAEYEALREAGFPNAAAERRAALVEASRHGRPRIGADLGVDADGLHPHGFGLRSRAGGSLARDDASRRGYARRLRDLVAESVAPLTPTRRPVDPAPPPPIFSEQLLCVPRRAENIDLAARAALRGVLVRHGLVPAWAELEVHDVGAGSRVYRLRVPEAQSKSVHEALARQGDAMTRIVAGLAETTAVWVRLWEDNEVKRTLAAMSWDEHGTRVDLGTQSFDIKHQGDLIGEPLCRKVLTACGVDVPALVDVACFQAKRPPEAVVSLGEEVPGLTESVREQLDEVGARRSRPEARKASRGDEARGPSESGDLFQRAAGLLRSLWKDEG